MGAVLNLESFDSQVGSLADDEQDVPKSYDEGFRDGQNAATQAIEAEQSYLRESVAEALIDGMFGYQEAQAHFTHGMTAFVTAILEQVVPSILAPALHMRVRDLLIEALERDASHPIVIRLPPDQTDAFKAVIADIAAAQVRIEEDTTLGDHAAFIVGKNAETSIDFDALAAAIADHTKILTTPAKEVS